MTTDFSEFFISINTKNSLNVEFKYSIYYRIFSPINESDIKADIILLSGICTNITHYTEISYFLSENGFRVILIDPPGFGLSSGMRAGLENYDKIDFFSVSTHQIYYYIIDGVLNDVYFKTKINKPKISLGDGFGGFLGVYHQHYLRSQLSYIIDGDVKNKFIGNILTNPVISIKNPNYSSFEKFLITTGLKSDKLYLYDIDNLQNYNLISDLEKRFQLFHSTLKSTDYIDYKLFLKVFNNKDLFNGKFIGLFNKQFCDNLLIFQSKNDFLSDSEDLKLNFKSFEVENKTLIENENYGHFILLEKDWKSIANQIILWINGIL